MNILIIGGSRFVGPLLVSKLLKKGHKITIFNRGKIKSSYEKEIKFIQGNRNDGFNIKDNFNVVIDMCAYNGLHTEKAISELNFDFYLLVLHALCNMASFLFSLHNLLPSMYRDSY